MVRKFLEDVFRRKLDVLHSARVVHTLYQQQKEGRYCDLKVLVEDQQYFVHRCVLASASAQLDAQINGLDTIQLVGVTNYGFEHLLEILYSGKMAKVATVDSTKFHEIVSAADALNAESVIEYCARERTDLMKFVLNQPQDMSRTPMETTTSQASTTISEVSVEKSLNVDSPNIEPGEVATSSEHVIGESTSTHRFAPQTQPSEILPTNTEPKIKSEPQTEELKESSDWSAKVNKEASENSDVALKENMSVDERIKTESVEEGSSTLPLPMPGQPGQTAVHSSEEAFVSKPDTTVGSADHVMPEDGSQNPFIHIDPRDMQNIQSLRTSMFAGPLGMKRVIKCVVCKQLFSSRHHLKCHMKKHAASAVKPFRCEVCGMKFNFQMTLLNHMKLHEGKKYVCKICGRDFKLNKNLVMHMQNVHTVEWDREQNLLKQASFGFPPSFSIPTPPGSSRRKTHPVKRPIAHETEIVNPEASFVPAEQPIPQSHDTKFPQKLQSNSEIEQLKSAVENVQMGIDGKYSCPLCGKGFSRRWNLKCHVLTHAENRIPRSRAKFPPKKPLPFGCPECGKSFQTAGSLQKHAILTHPYSKTLFGFSGIGQPPFSEMEEMVQSASQSSTSTAIQPRAEPSPVVCWCKVCGRGFRRLRNLRNHMETHSGMGYECHICGRTFAQRDGLNGHLWIHGGLGGSKTGATQPEAEKGGPEGAEKSNIPPDTT
uniref:zinc finger and BTB domain-containing protein 42-like isoform X1 n=1 Tax=Styela clava TaxID=7725 RepID=UPI0019394408|nr:zinc finger and BTB domain-containing protein 42-like isoform X1 [Styela clava]